MSIDLVSLRDAFATVTAASEVHRTTLGVVAEWLDPDVCLVASKRDGRWNPVASVPTRWTDSDELLSPVSLPCVTVTDGEGCYIEDRADVRSAAVSAESEPGASITYRSLLAVPFGDADLLLVGAHEPAAFSEGTLKDVRQLSAYAATLRDAFQRGGDVAVGDDRLQQAAAALDHDARNQLTILRGTLELTGDTLAQDHVSRFSRAVDDLEALIDDTTSLLRSGKSVTDVTSVDLARLATETWDVIDADEVELEVGALGTVRADHSRLSQLLDNLFRNAVEHADPAGAIRVERLEGGQGFFVEDDGPGIETADREAIFEFGQTSSADHTGYGLTIVQWIADAHGWNVSVSTGSDGGARFEFRGVEPGIT